MPSFEITALGRVQGVGFRWFVHDCAMRCDVRGYVKNAPDGSVQILAQAEEIAFELFSSLIRKGNGFARVDDLIIAPLTCTKEYDDFTIR